MADKEQEKPDFAPKEYKMPNFDFSDTDIGRQQAANPLGQAALGSRAGQHRARHLPRVLKRDEFRLNRFGIPKSGDL